ncbi:MAG: hypothetical protein WEK74_13350 [Hydrogenophaga sp.]
MSDDTQFENFKTALAEFMRNTNTLVDHMLSDEAQTAHLAPMIPWVSEAMSASMDPAFLEKIALAYWSHMGMTATSTPARLKIMELEGLSEAIKQSLLESKGQTPTKAQTKLLKLSGLTVTSLLDGMGDMFPWVNGILRSTLGAIDVARN